MEHQTTTNSYFLNWNEALEYMKGSKSIQDWNERRESIKRRFEPAEGDKRTTNQFITHIDTQGLVVKVLGQDKEFVRS